MLESVHFIDYYYYCIDRTDSGVTFLNSSYAVNWTAIYGTMRTTLVPLPYDYNRRVNTMNTI